MYAIINWFLALAGCKDSARITLPLQQDCPKRLSLSESGTYVENSRVDTVFADSRLPLPLVHYPAAYGTFLAYSNDARDRPIFCSCAEKPVNHLAALLAQNWGNLTPAQARWHQQSMQALAVASFPISVGDWSLAKFGERLCHRCNGISPNWRYCAPIYGSLFKQYHGWYVAQEFLAQGVFNSPDPVLPYPFLDDICPLRLQDIICSYRAAQAAVDAAYPERFITSSAPPHRPVSRAQRRLEQAKRQVRRQLEIEMENPIRIAFGFPKVGEAWKGENALVALLEQIFPCHRIIRHFRPEWLHRMELDIYIPELNVAFEYQGRQHYEPVIHWGGDHAFAQLCQRDERKARICKQKGLTLIPIDYEMRLTREDILGEMSKAGVDLLLDVNWDDGQSVENGKQGGTAT